MTEGNSDGSPLLVARETAIQSGRPICLDSSALIAYLANEPHARYVAPLVEDLVTPLLISTVTLSEIVVRRAARGRAHAEAVIAEVLHLPTLTVMAVDEVVALETAMVRAETALPLPDAAVVASARLASAVTIIGNDRRWRGRALGVPFVCLDDLP